MIILHAGHNEGFVPNVRKKTILLSYIKIIKHQYMQENCKKKSKPELRLEFKRLRVFQESVLTTDPMRQI